MSTSRRTLLLLSLSTLFLTSDRAYASQILYFASPWPCSGVPLTCYPGGAGAPVLWQGPLYVPMILPANSRLEEIDLWGDSATPVGIWDAVTQPPPFFPNTIPHNELVRFGPGDLDASFTFFATDGISGEPYYELHYRLDNPVLLAEGGTYYVGVIGFPMVGATQIFFTNAFSSPANVNCCGTIPGVAIRAIGQRVPEPPTLLLMLPGAAVATGARAVSAALRA